MILHLGERAKVDISDNDTRKRILTSLHKLVRLPVELSFWQRLTELLTSMEQLGCDNFKNISLKIM